MSAPVSQPEQPASAVKKRLADRICPQNVQEVIPEVRAYTEMLEFERKLEYNITRKALDIQEAMKRPARVKRTLRIFLTNLFYTQHDGLPSWELRVEGRLIDDTRAMKRKFSSFFRSLIIELDDTMYGPDNHLIEWYRTAQTSEADGFQVRRPGDLPVKCTILFQLEHQPPHFKIDPRLAKLLGKTTDTRPAVITALWQYIKTKTLQDSNEREYINNDRYLAQIFGCKRMKFSEIPAKLNSLLSPPDPVIIHHSIVRNSGETQRSIYEIDVEIEDSQNKISMNAYTMSTSNQQELQQLDQKICDTLDNIKTIRNTFDLFTSFAQDPHQFTNKWLSTQTSEEERRAEYFYQPDIQIGVNRYKYRQMQIRWGRCADK